MRKFLRLLATAELIGVGVSIFRLDLFLFLIFCISFIVTVYLLNKKKHE